MKEMKKISPRVERSIAENIDLRLLVYLYMYQHPEATKAGLAARLGIAPITMSRAIAAGKKGIDKDLVPVVLELLQELDYSDLSNGMNKIRFLWMEQGRYEREGLLREILCRKLNLSADHWQPDRAATNLDYVLVQEDGKKRYFNEIPGDAGNVYRHLPRAMLSISRIPGEDEVTMVCYAPETLQEMMSRRTAQMIKSYNPTHPITVMLMDLEQAEITAEYILYTPGKELFSVYELEDMPDTEDL